MPLFCVNYGLEDFYKVRKYSETSEVIKKPYSHLFNVEKKVIHEH